MTTQLNDLPVQIGTHNEWTLFYRPIENDFLATKGRKESDLHVPRRHQEGEPVILKLTVKGTPEQVQAEADKRGVKVSIQSTEYDEETDAHETTVRVWLVSEEQGLLWLEEADDEFRVGTVVGGF